VTYCYVHKQSGRFGTFGPYQVFNDGGEPKHWKWVSDSSLTIFIPVSEVDRFQRLLESVGWTAFGDAT
jgi:hypothetical protein